MKRNANLAALRARRSAEQSDQRHRRRRYGGLSVTRARQDAEWKFALEVLLGRGIPHRHFDAGLMFVQVGPPNKAGTAVEIAEKAKRTSVHADAEPVLQKAHLLLGIAIDGGSGLE